MIKFTNIVAVSFAMTLVATSAMAHRSGCHRWHSCPSDSGSYVCGDTGYSNFCPRKPAYNSAATFNTIYAIQTRLLNLGYSPGYADGIMGPRTRAAIIQFQRSNGLKVNGRASKSLLSEVLK